jgi:phosphate-selective porin
LHLAAVSARAEDAARPAGAWKLAPFSIENAEARFRITLTGYAQHDTRSYEDWTAFGGPDARRPANDWRRVRLGTQASWRRLDFAGEIAVNNKPGQRLNDAWLGLRLPHGLRVRVGRQKLAGSAEWLTSNARTDLMERAVVVDALAPGRATGVQLFKDGGLVDAQAGVFDGDNRPGPSGAGTTVAGGFIVKPRPWLDLSGSFSQGEVRAPGAGSLPASNGFSVKSVTGYRLWRAVETNGSRTRLSGGGALRIRGFGLKAELVRRREERQGQGPELQDLPRLIGHGFAMTATCLLTGEAKARTIRPRRPLPHGPGAVEVAGRYEELAVDGAADTEAAGGKGAASSRAPGLHAATLGVSWWPVAVVRLMGNALFERYSDPLGAPERGRQGTYVTLLARLQVSLP